jgi:hypothetical protein
VIVSKNTDQEKMGSTFHRIDMEFSAKQLEEINTAHLPKAHFTSLKGTSVGLISTGNCSSWKTLHNVLAFCFLAFIYSSPFL